MRSPTSRLAALLALAPLSACTCSTEAPVQNAVSIDQLTLTVAPTGAAEDGVWVVTPRATLALQWGVSGDVGRVVLAAGERVLFAGDGAGGGTFTDDCSAADAVCLTADEGPILFTLTVLGKADNTTSATESLQVEVRAPRAPLAIDAFTADEAELAAGGSTMLRFATTSAEGLTLVATDLAGAEARTILAPTTTELAIAPEDTTTYALEATAGGETASAELTVGVRPAVTLSAPATATPGEAIELSFTSLGATALELSVDGAPLDLTGLTPAADTLTFTIPADAVAGDRLAFSLVGIDDEEPARESLPATAEVELVVP